MILRSSCSSALLTASFAAWASDGSMRSAVELVGDRAVGADGEGLDVFRGGRRCRLVGALRWFLLGALIWAIDPEAQTN